MPEETTQPTPEQKAKLDQLKAAREAEQTESKTVEQMMAELPDDVQQRANEILARSDQDLLFARAERIGEKRGLIKGSILIIGLGFAFWLGKLAVEHQNIFVTNPAHTCRCK